MNARGFGGSLDMPYLSVGARRAHRPVPLVNDAQSVGHWAAWTREHLRRWVAIFRRTGPTVFEQGGGQT